MPNIDEKAGTANGYTELGFNTYGTGTGKTIKDGGASTKALQDADFRDALGYAIDKQTLVDKVLGGYGEPGTTEVPPFQTRWHVEPDHPRTFDIELAKQKLDAAGYVLNADGKRLDKQGKPINLSLVFPDSDANYPQAAQFIQAWFAGAGDRRLAGPVRLRHPDRQDAAARGRQGLQGQVRHVHLGLGG